MQNRAIILGLSALLFVSIHGPSFLKMGSAKADQAYRTQMAGVFKNWVKRTVWPKAKAAGVSRATFDAAFRGVKLNWSLPDLRPFGLDGKPVPPDERRVQKKKKRQPEFDKPGNYFPRKHLKNLVARGRRKLADWEETLAKIEKKYGVPRTMILAIWGRETAYGTYGMRHNAIQALATQAFMGRRKDYFFNELILGLQILNEGHISLNKMRGSWAGAMGHTQFLPSDFMKHAVDFNGDGKRDIWGTIPDALASTANYLKKNGWQSGRTWGYEIHASKNLDCALEGTDKGRPVREWLRFGVKRTHNRKFTPEQLNDKAFLVMPAGVRGPAFLVLENFYVIKTYNMADLYALFVGHVADRISVDRAFAGKWGNVSGFSRNSIKWMQKVLTKRGVYSDKIDGLVGSQTRSSIGRYQRQAGLPVTCYPNKSLFNHLRRATN